MPKPQILALGKLMPVVTEGLQAEFDLRVIPPDADREAFLQSVAPEIRGLACGGGLVDGAFQDRFPKLEIIANFGVGYDNIDAAHAARLGVMVTNTPDVLTDEVADLATGLMIAAVREIAASDRWVRAGNWTKSPYPLSHGTLRGKKLGILGLGRIGKAVAKRAEAFGLDISYYGRSEQPDLPYTYFSSLKDIASHSDILLSVLPATGATHKAVNADILAALGSDGTFINVGRGSTVDEEALVRALQDGTIHSAGLDVFADEPNVPEALLTMDNVVLLPHIGSASKHTRNAMGRLQLENLRQWFDGKGPVTPVAETPWPAE
ncbi:MAG: dihydrofolate reductase [Rhizobiaceae bacterium MnEN-MB40S]|nr:MAG: dihydrofolate reductase [Rhizobiaceae bacterium MnEN-MB40S]